MNEPNDKQDVDLKLVERNPEYETDYQKFISHPENYSIEEFERLTEHVYRERFDFNRKMALMCVRFKNRKTGSQLVKKAFLASMRGDHEEFERLLKILQQKNKLGINLVSDE